MKKILLPALLLIVSLSACKRQLSFDERCQAEAREQTAKLCPRAIMPGITLDSLTYVVSDRSLRYYYTMSDEYDNSETISAGEEKFREALKQQIIQSLDLKRYKDNRVTFRYIYFSKSTGKKLLEEKYTEKDYAAKPV